jgi:PAS domain S-box-containing protein
MLKLSIFDLEIIETAEQTQKHLQKIVEIGEDRFETKHRCKNGQTIDVELSVKIQRNQNLIVAFVRDITERVQNGKKIADLYERLSLSHEASSAGTWDWDIPNNIFYWSDEFLKLFGMASGTVPGFESWTKSLHPDDIEAASKRIQDAIDNKTDLLQDYRIILPDNTLRWIRASGKVTYQNDIPIRMIGLCIDFTDQKLAEEAIIESEKKFRSLFETMSEGIVYEDHDGNIISANPAAERLLGLSLDQLQGRPSLDPRWKSIHEDGSPFPGENHSLHVAATTGKPATGEIMGIYNPNLDSYIWLSVNSTPEFLPGEKIPFRAFAVFRDITDRKKSDEALKLSEERYRLLFQNLTAGFALHEIILNTEGKPCDYRFLEINPAFETLTGLKAKDLLGKTQLEVLPNLEPYWIDTYGEVALKGKIVNFENYSQELNKHYQVSAYSPEPGKFATVFIDVTERKLAEDALEKSRVSLQESYEASSRARQSLLSVLEDQRLADREIQKLNAELERRVIQRTAQLEAANKELETFTYSVSHDLKAPLRGIDGYSKLLQDIHSNNLNEEAKTFISTIRSSTRQMNQLIEDLLEYSRLERSNLRNEKIRLIDLIDSTTSLFKNDLKIGKFVLKLDIPDVELLADEKGLSIVLRNILENAIKFTKEKSNPTLEISLDEQPTSWIIRVKDNGIGFDMKYHKRIFEIFQRLHRAEDYAGTGIGLAMVGKAMQRMHGKVWAESIPGEGSIFYLEIPKL